MVTITKEVLNTVEKTYVGGVFHSIKFTGQLYFTGLTLADRRLLGLPVKRGDTALTDLDTVEAVVISLHIPPTINEAEIKSIIKERLERKRLEYEARLVVASNEPIVLVADAMFVIKLSTIPAIEP